VVVVVVVVMVAAFNSGEPVLLSNHEHLRRPARRGQWHEVCGWGAGARAQQLQVNHFFRTVWFHQLLNSDVGNSFVLSRDTVVPVAGGATTLPRQQSCLPLWLHPLPVLQVC